MYVEPDNFFHLTYCTNIHPGNGWSEVYANLQRYVPVLKAHLAPHNTFGIGLRLSGRESSELLQSDHLQQFQDFLQEHGLYVFTLNGFPYGPFHRQPVKALVHAPDWRDEDRKSTRLNSSHSQISYAVFCLKKKKKSQTLNWSATTGHDDI